MEQMPPEMGGLPPDIPPELLAQMMQMQPPPPEMM
jgi:hypothetical protein